MPFHAFVLPFLSLSLSLSLSLPNFIPLLSDNSRLCSKNYLNRNLLYFVVITCITVHRERVATFNHMKIFSYRYFDYRNLTRETKKNVAPMIDHLTFDLQFKFKVYYSFTLFSLLQSPVTFHLTVLTYI